MESEAPGDKFLRLKTGVTDKIYFGRRFRGCYRLLPIMLLLEQPLLDDESKPPSPWVEKHRLKICGLLLGSCLLLNYAGEQWLAEHRQQLILAQSTKTCATKPWMPCTGGKCCPSGYTCTQRSPKFSNCAPTPPPGPPPFR